MAIIFNNRSDYVKVEAGFGGSLLVLTSFIGIVLAILYWKFCCLKNNNGPTCSILRCCSNKSCESSFVKLITYCTSLESLHNILGIVFSNITQIIADGNSKPSLIISNRESLTGCNGCFTYTYYTYMMFISLMWFIAAAIEFSVFQKITTCNDINLKVKSFRCFDVDNQFETVDCQAPDVDEKKVICYLYNPSIGGLGVAYSTAKFVGITANLGYRMIFNITKKCGSYCCVAFRFIGTGLAVILLITYLHIARNITAEYFTFGLVPMRVAFLVLLCLTVGGILLIPPWCQYPVKYYQNKYYNVMAYDIESGTKMEGTCTYKHG